MSDIVHRTVTTNGIEMHVAEAGEGPCVLLLHGFPEFWYSWRHQIPALARAGHRVVAPDQRGYGTTEAPPAIEDYDIFHLCDDVAGLLDALGEEQAVVVGHDWGSLVLSSLVHLHPDRVRAAVWMSVPYLPRTPIKPTDLFRAQAGDNFMYIVYFQDVGPADEELGRDPRRAMARILWSVSGDAPDSARRQLPHEGTGFLDGMEDPPALPSWLTEADVDAFGEAFAGSGFTGGLNWYRNFDRNWERTEHLAGATVRQPGLFIAGDRDPVVANRALVDAQASFVPDLRGSVIIEGAGHWTQQERAAEVNTALLDFIAGL